VLVVASASQGRQSLTDGALACPSCAAALRSWGWAKPRRVRDRGGRISLLRLRRARCRACSVSHVLLPAAWLPRRLDEVNVIGSALLGAACGAGHRPLAAALNRPEGTVRGWLRAARVHSGWLHAELASAGALLPDHRLGTAVPSPRRVKRTVLAGWRLHTPYHLLAGETWGD
jgi:hypothetical protein